MSRIIMQHTYCYRIKELCIKLVIETNLKICKLKYTSIKTAGLRAEI